MCANVGFCEWSAENDEEGSQRETIERVRHQFAVWVDVEMPS